MFDGSGKSSYVHAHLKWGVTGIATSMWWVLAEKETVGMASEHDELSMLSEGRELLQAGRFERALACFDELIDLDPSPIALTSAYMNRLSALRQLGRHQEADTDEAKWEAVRQAAIQRKASGGKETDSQIQPAQQATISSNTERAAKLRRVNEKLAEGTRLLQEEDFEGALACSDEVIGLNPSATAQVRAYEQRTVALWELGRPEEAVASEQAAESLRPRPRSETFTPTHEEQGGGGGEMLIGALFFFGGLIATIVSYSSAAPGGTYAIWWGAMLIGAIEFVRGMAKS